MDCLPFVFAIVSLLCSLASAVLTHVNYRNYRRTRR